MFSYRMDRLSVFEWIRKAERGQVSTPARSRWTQAQQSRFVESILLGFPLPPVYVAQETSGKLDIIDGRERIGALQSFVNGEFRLCGLEFLDDDDLDGLRFCDLPMSERTRIEDASFTVYVLPPSTDAALEQSLIARIHA